MEVKTQTAKLPTITIWPSVHPARRVALVTRREGQLVRELMALEAEQWLKLLQGHAGPVVRGHQGTRCHPSS